MVELGKAGKFIFLEDGSFFLITISFSLISEISFSVKTIKETFLIKFFLMIKQRLIFYKVKVIHHKTIMNKITYSTKGFCNILLSNMMDKKIDFFVGIFFGSETHTTHDEQLGKKGK